MTPEEIDAMPAGREMDALVAEKVMGWYWGEVRDQRWREQFPALDKSTNELSRPWPDGSGKSVWHLPKNTPWWEWGRSPRYSTDISAAWDVAEKFIRSGCSACVEGDGHTGYGATCTYGNGRYESRADSAPLAICRAALKAVLA